MIVYSNMLINLIHSLTVTGVTLTGLVQSNYYSFLGQTKESDSNSLSLNLSALTILLIDGGGGCSAVVP